MILAIQSTTFGSYGGISTYNQLVCKALNEFEAASEKRVLLAGDSPDDTRKHASDLQTLSIEAFSDERSRLLERCLRLGLTRDLELLLLGHVNYSPIGRLFRSIKPSLKYGVFVHGIDVWSRLPFLRRKSLQDADFIISVSEYTKRVCIDVNGAQPERFHLLRNAIIASDVPALTEFQNHRPSFRLLSVCRLAATERYKGVDTVIEALPEILSSAGNVEYDVVGEGADIDRLQKLALQLGVADHVHFLGWVNERTLENEYDRCDIFVMPSKKEGFGCVFIEAMQYGKPVVAADAGGAPEAVDDGKTGLLVPYGDTKQLSAAITRLCLDPSLRRQLGEAGRERVQGAFTFTHFKHAFTEILRKHLDRR